MLDNKNNLTFNPEKTIVFDLDNTLCKTEYVNYEDAVPIKEIIETVNNLFESGWYIIIETARGYSNSNCHGIRNPDPEKVKEIEEITKAQLSKWNLKYHHLRVGTKFPARMYIDDRGINSLDFFNRGTLL